jgi:hypothetical protein
MSKVEMATQQALGTNPISDQRIRNALDESNRNSAKKPGYAGFF